MSLPVAQDVYDELLSFSVTSDKILESIVNKYLFQAVNHVQKLIDRKLDEETTVTGYYSGDGTNTLLVDHKKINEIVSVTYTTRAMYYQPTAISYVFEAGLITMPPGYIFRKGNSNIQVKYKIGGEATEEEKRAVVLTAVEYSLNRISQETGGGSISVQGWAKDYGERGKYSTYKEDLNREVYALLADQITNVAGQR